MISTKLLARLKDPSLVREEALCGGVWITGRESRQITVEDPATGECLAHVCNTELADWRVAIEHAAAAQASWAAATGKERAIILRCLYDLVVANQEDLATILTAEMGKPLAEARGEISYGAGYIEWFAEEAKRIYGDTIPGHQRNKRLVVVKEPIGVVAGIAPWNFPSAMVCRKLAPALAAGCAIVFKPAAETPLSSIALAILAERAGLPAGLVSILPTSDAKAFGEEVCSNPIVKKLTFTGSTDVGRVLMAQGAKKILKLSLELGGNAPFIVFDDADIDKAIEGVMVSKFRNNGQTCVCANRIYVQTGIHDAFVDKLAAAVGSLRVGSGFGHDTDLGPLIHEKAMQKFFAHIDDARDKGGKVVMGGVPSPLGRSFVEPTVITGVTKEMAVAREETFAPLAPVFRFDSVDDVIRDANDTEFGLAAYFYARDLTRVWRVAEALQYGMVGINTGLISTEVAPFGGIKQSGFGREGSKYGLDDFLNVKYLCFGEIS